MRIQNMDTLASHGNVRGRQAVLAILEAGLQAADPYNNTLKLMRIEGRKLIIGNRDFEPRGDPRAGQDEVFDLDKLGRIFVFGAGKGAQRVAKAIEDILGERLTGGQVIDKHGGEIILKRIGVTLGAHPVPDEGCVTGCERILALAQGLREDDLVFTIAANGISALLTKPVPGVSLEDVRRTTYLMQIERGAPTGDLNAIRNHLDAMKSGRLTRHLQPATCIHLLAIDPGEYDQLLYRNRWLHPLPDESTFADAVSMLKKWDAWDEAPASVRAFLEAADPRWETVKADEFQRTRFRIYGTMPNHLATMPTAQAKARELGYTPYTLAQGVTAEASQNGSVLATIATTIERTGQPFTPPCALFSSGEMLVTVGKEKGIGGRNQEFALGAALRIAGSKNIVVGGVDTDGTDGPGAQYVKGAEEIPTLAGGIVDGETLAEARAAGLDLFQELKRHNATPPLWQLQSGIVAEHSISLNDLDVVLIMGRSKE
jgi:glycerate-2-kinase